MATVRGTSTLDAPYTLLRANGVNEGDPAGLSNSPVRADDTIVQYRKCPNDGNCTHPETCTCALGWTGRDCTIPICAQECLNGVCAAVG